MSDDLHPVLIMTDDDEALLRLGQEIHGWVDTAKTGLTKYAEAHFAIGRRLLQARTILSDNQSYGRWFRRQDFGFKQQWGSVLCRAAEREVDVRELMAGQKEPNIEAAVKAITQAERAEQREAFTSQQVDPSTAEPFVEGGSDSPAGEGTGTENPSPAGRTCGVAGCPRTVCARGLCRRHYDSIRTRRSQESRRRKPTADPAYVLACPDDLVPVVAQLVDNDARPIFTLLWRAIGNWHLQGLLQEEAS